ncbi:unnamed protein product, partial [Amoebophrya sp. A25]
QQVEQGGADKAPGLTTINATDDIVMVHEVEADNEKPPAPRSISTQHKLVEPHLQAAADDELFTGSAE